MLTKKATKRYPKRKSFRWLFIGFGFSVLSVLSATAGALLALYLYETPLQQAAMTPEEEAVFNQTESVSATINIPKLSRPINILVIGVKVLTSDLEEPPAEDLGYHALVDSFEGHADTMLLVRFDPETEKITVLSIPRDTKVYIQEYGTAKINFANYYGGPALSAQAVSDLLGGVPIDNYIRVNVQAIEKLIDALGGVTVYVPKDMKYTDHSQHLYIDLKQGLQHLNGDQALQFLRFRYDEFGDIGRVQRQQILMRAIVEQHLKPQTILKTKEIFSVVKSNIDTNLSVKELVALASLGGQTQRSDVQMLMLPGNFNGDGRHGVSYWLPQEQAIAQIMFQYFDIGYNPLEFTQPANVKVAIQDSTGDQEAVQSLISELRQAGYQKIYVSKNWPENLAVTRIIAQKGDDGGASALRTTLGIGEVLVESTGIFDSDITIVLGTDWQQQQAATTANSL